MTFQIHEFAFDDQLAVVLTNNIATTLQKSIAERGYASLAVSGGSTPRVLFQRLSNLDIDWSLVWITLVDERWVGEFDKHSNANLVHTSLLVGRAAAAYFVSLKTEHADPFKAQIEVENRLKAMPMPFDVVLLGMGTDGHTASFSPHSAQLSTALDMLSGHLCVALHPPEAPYERMTLTLPVLVNTSLLVVHIIGQKKRQVLAQAAAPGPVSDMPIRAVLHQHQSTAQVYYADY